MRVDSEPELRMRCLTNSECHKWIKSRGLIERPYSTAKLQFVQYRIKKSELELTAIVDGIAKILDKDSELLLVAENWGLYAEEEMAEIVSIRATIGESRRIIDAPGHELKRSDTNLRSKLLRFVLGARTGWSAYVYAFPSKTTLFLWEGDIIDLWPPKSGTIGKFDSFLERVKPS